MLILKGKGTLNSHVFQNLRDKLWSFFVGLKSINQFVMCLPLIRMHMHLVKFVVVLCQAIH